jgi:iron complex outermembrane recepter protein
MKFILSAMVGATLALTTLGADADGAPGERRITLEIESKTLAGALDQWAAQSGYQIVLQNWEIAKGLAAPSVKGTFSAQAALSQLLDGTPFTYVWINDKAVSIRGRLDAVPKLMTIGGAEESTSHVNGLFSEDDRLSAKGLHPFEGQAQPVLPRAQSEESLGEDRKIQDLEEVVVTGSRLKGQGPDSGPAPVTVFTRERIDQLGAASIADVLDYLPQQPFAARDQDNFGGSRAIRLRGLGLGTTLVLIDGRRAVTSALQGARNYFDLNTIPLGAVERIEVLSDSASAVYGADAVGGVLNIILKDEVEHPDVTLYYGAARSGGAERRASLSLGGDATRVRGLVTLDVFDRDYLHGQDRDRSANQDFTRFGSIDGRFPFSNPGNVFSMTGNDLPGVGSPIAAVPRGSSGIGLTPADFIATAGQTNLESINRFSSLIPKTQRVAATGKLTVDLSGDIAAFVEALYSHREDDRLVIPDLLPFGLVPADNPFNPFGEDVGVNYLFTGVGTIRDHSEAKAFRAVTGLRGSHERFDWEASLLASDEDADDRSFNRVDPARVAAALAAPSPEDALNVFQDGPGGSDALLSSLRAAPIVDKYASKALQGGGFVRADVVNLPSGVLQVVGGMEVRSEEITFDSLTAGISINPERESSALYAETRVPLMSALQLTLAGRYDDYDDFGSTFNPQFGLAWTPIPQLLLRLSHGTSFRAPSLFELYAPVTVTNEPILDPSRGNEFVVIESRGGGNPALRPEESDSTTFGLVFAPADDHGLRIEASYWRISQDVRVQRLDPNLVLANEEFFSDRVHRAAPTTDDIAAGLPGQLLSLDWTSVNSGSLDTRGLDAQLSLPLETNIGRWTASVAATWVDEYRVADFPTTPPVERVNVASSQGTIPRWRASATLDWNYGPAAITTIVRYIGPYRDTLFDVRTDRTVGAQTLVDLQGSLALSGAGDSWPLSGLTIRLGVINLFDSDPHFSEVGFNTGYDPSLADVRQRFGYISLSKSF